MNFWLPIVVFLTTTITAQAETLRLAVTTSFANSGLSDVLIPVAEAETGLDIQLLVVGTGQALRLGEAGDVDAVLVHARAQEEAFVAAGHGTHRREIMFNDFVLVGPKDDPAGTQNMPTARAAFVAIADRQSPFVSRGDDSGTHTREQALWAQAAIVPTGDWYRAVGQGMGAALNIAAAIDAYILTDRASWLSFGNTRNLTLLFADDPALFNQYTFIQVTPKAGDTRAQRLEDWLVSPAARDLINGHRIAGQQLFEFNAK